MSTVYTYPGVYVEEVPSGVHTITGVATSNTAFVDYFLRGPSGQPSTSSSASGAALNGPPVQINSFVDFQRTFGGLCQDSEASYAIMQYFLNGGQIAWVVRVAVGATVAYVDCEITPSSSLRIWAANAGSWGNNLQVQITYPPPQSPPVPPAFNLFVREWVNNTAVNSETYYNLSLNPADPQYAPAVVNAASALIYLSEASGGLPAKTNGWVPFEKDSGSDGMAPSQAPATWATAIGNVFTAQGGSSLERVPVDILCLPITALMPDADAGHVITLGQQFCASARAFYIIDAPPSTKQPTPQSIRDWLNAIVPYNQQYSEYSAFYFPRLSLADPLKQYAPREVGASGTIAGIYAFTDANRGVWKAPAGTGATITGASLLYNLTDAENGTLNPLGINGLRTFPVYGNVVWGARTLAGADQLMSDYKYVPVRRLTSYIESSLYQGTQWAVFEPNDETLWSSLRLSVNTFMAGLAQQGAFYTYLVRCDSTTTTQTDIANGICNIVVAFAPVKPAEFIVIVIQQLAGQTAA